VIHILRTSIYSGDRTPPLCFFIFSPPLQQAVYYKHNPEKEKVITGVGLQKTEKAFDYSELEKIVLTKLLIAEIGIFRYLTNITNKIESSKKDPM
jgi:hypothetical protein